ncbi:MAG: hypothetical protein ABIQ99_03880 [Thermoflexales bacterium]
MLIFRSEDHLSKWLTDWRMPLGAIISLEQCWTLAQVFYEPDRRDPGYRRKTVDELETLFTEMGFTSEFWRLR